MNDITRLQGISFPGTTPGIERKPPAGESEPLSFDDAFRSATGEKDQAGASLPAAMKASRGRETPATEAPVEIKPESGGLAGASPIHAPHPMEEVSLLGSLELPGADLRGVSYDPGVHGEIFAAAVNAPHSSGPELLPVPDTRQSTEYSCGASALQATLMYYGEEYGEQELMTMLGTTYNGTNPRDIARVARELGFQVELREQCTLEDLEKSIRNRVPVIVSGQAWREGDDLKKPWSEVWESGHYMVIIGLDEKNVYFEDPSLLGSKGFMPRDEFQERWHDVDEKKYLQLGIFISGKKPAPPPPFMHIE